MLVELGPVLAADVLSWTRCARRVGLEMTNSGNLSLSEEDTTDWYRHWSALIDSWGDEAAKAETFRWSEAMDSEVAAFVLHGFERLIQSPALPSCITNAESKTHTPFTAHVLKAFVYALGQEGPSYEHHADQVRSLLATLESPSRLSA